MVMCAGSPYCLPVKSILFWNEEFVDQFLKGFQIRILDEIKFFNEEDEMLETRV